MEQQIGTAQLVVDDNELCIAKKNIIANGDFSGKLNFWTTGSGSSAMIVNNGCQYLGNGNFYQSMKNITLGVQHIARVLVYSISGPVTARLGTTAGASDLGIKTLSVGWNNFVFTGSSFNFITIVGGSADSTCVITKIECRESINLTASGDFFLGGAVSGVTTLTGNGAISGFTTGSFSSHISTLGIKKAVIAGSTIAVGEVCFLASDGKWDKVDGILDGTDVGFKAMLGMCLVSANDTQASEMLLYGSITYASFPTLTVGSPVYLSDTAGTVVVAQPSTTNFAIRIVGFATATDTLFFNPSNDWIVHT